MIPLVRRFLDSSVLQLRLTHYSREIIMNTPPLGQSSKLMSLTQLNNEVLLSLTGTDSNFYWWLLNLFTGDKIKSGSLTDPKNQSDCGLISQGSMNSVYKLHCGTRSEDYIYISQFDPENESSLWSDPLRVSDWETQSTPTMCIVGSVAYILFRGAAEGYLTLGAYDLLTSESKLITTGFGDGTKTTTGPGIVPITTYSMNQGVQQAHIKLLVVWTTVDSGYKTYSKIYDPTDGTFGNLHQVPTNGSAADVCLRLLTDNIAMLVYKGATDSDPAEVVVYKVSTTSGAHEGKWAPHAHRLDGVFSSVTPTILPYSRLGIAAAASGIPSGLLVCYSEPGSFEIKLKDFLMSDVLG